MRALSRKLIILGVIAGLSLPVLGQMNTLNFMKGVPQSNRINPAYQIKGDFYIGFPLIAPARAGFSSSSQNFGNYLQPHPTEDSLVTFLHPLGDKDEFIGSLKPVNRISTNVGVSLASFGFRTEVGYFSLDVAIRYDGTVRYPEDLVHLLVYGTDDGRTYSLDGLGMDLAVYNEIAVGWSKQLSDQLTVGAKAKLLFGLGDFTTRNSELSLTTSQESWHIKSDMQFATSLGFAEVEYNDEGLIEDVIVDEELGDLSPYALAGYIFGSGNTGFGIDLGAVYTPMENLTLSASVVDLSFIRWKQEVHEVSYIADYNFPGLVVNPFEFSDDYTFDDYLDSSLTEISDSLSGFLTMNPGSAYSKRLNTKVYLGGYYQVNPNIGFGLTSRTDFGNGYVTEQVTATANFSLLRLVNLALSYSYMNSNFKNIGAGLSFNVGPLNLYMVSDNILNMLFWPTESRSVGIWVGLNLVFGYKEKIDLPLVQ